MRNGFVSSALLHIGVLLIAYYGVPALFEPTPGEDHPIVVDFVTITSETNVPPPSPPPEKPAPKPIAEEQTAALPEEAAPPVPLPSMEKTKEKAPETPETFVPPPKPQAKPKPKAKPKPEVSPDPFLSVLKKVEKFRDENTETAALPAPQVIKAPKHADPATMLTLSELDAIRSQISRCWNVPVGAKDAENLVVDIRVHVNPDGTIREARILDTDRMQRDSFFRTAAESAYRAVVNPRCSPLRLPPEKYEQWKTFTLSFNPKEMFGT